MRSDTAFSPSPSGSPSEPIILRYTLEHADHIAYALHSVRTDVLHRRRTGINRVVLAFALAVWLLFLGRVAGFDSPTLIALLSAGVGVLGYTLYPRLIEAAVRRNTTAFYNRSPKARSAQEVHLDDSGLLGRSSDSEHRFALEAVEHLEQTPEHVFVQLKGNNTLIVPDRAFSGAEQRAAFVSRLSGALFTGH